MSQDRPPFDRLPDDEVSEAPERRQTRLLLVLLSVLLVVGTVVVVVLLAGQRGPEDGGTSGDGPATATSTPTDDPGGTGTADADLATALTDLDSARSTLDTATTSAGELLTATEGKVADEASRVGLVDALATARTTLDADVDRTRISDVQALVTRTRASTANIQHAAGIVADSHEEWLQQQAPPTGDPAAPTPGPPVSPVDPLPVPTDLGDVPGPVTPPDRTPRPGPAPVPIPDDQN